jgi:hypothetical protein
MPRYTPDVPVWAGTVVGSELLLSFVTATFSYLR